MTNYYRDEPEASLDAPGTDVWLAAAHATDTGDYTKENEAVAKRQFGETRRSAL